MLYFCPSTKISFHIYLLKQYPYHFGHSNKKLSEFKITPEIKNVQQGNQINSLPILTLFEWKVTDISVVSR